MLDFKIRKYGTLRLKKIYTFSHMLLCKSSDKLLKNISVVSILSTNQLFYTYCVPGVMLDPQYALYLFHGNEEGQGFLLKGLF